MMQANELDISQFLSTADRRNTSAPDSIPGRNRNSVPHSFPGNGGVVQGGSDFAAAFLRRQQEERREQYTLALRRRALFGLPLGNLSSIREDAAAHLYAGDTHELLARQAIEARLGQLRGVLATGNTTSSGADALRCLSRATALPASSTPSSLNMNTLSNFSGQPFSTHQASQWEQLTNNELVSSLVSATPLHGGSFLLPNYIVNGRGDATGGVDQTGKRADKKVVAPLKEEDEDAYFSQPMSSKDRFPVKLYRMIYEARQAGKENVVSFLPHGRAFAIHDKETFIRDILPHYFPGCQLPSFQKQLNLYGFHKVTVGKDKGAFNYFHAHFLKGKPSLSEKIQRRRPHK